MNIFICYAKEDSQSANRLYDDLLSVPGLTPWLDSKKLLPGARWKWEIMEALKTCDLFVLLLSKNSVSKSGFVQKEISEALDKLKSIPPDTVYLIPARLDDCRPKHPELNELQWVDLFPDWKSGCDLIIQATKKLKGEPFNPPSAPIDIIIETITSVDAFERRLETRGEMRGCDAMELSFHNKILNHLDFSGANFVRCQFTGCDFQACNLKGANFEGAVFNNCRLANAVLWGVNFWGADLAGIHDIEDAILKHTNFFLTLLAKNHKRYISNNKNTIRLGDYDSFLRYFSEEVAMNEAALGETFIWINHRYFRMMFGKNRKAEFHIATINDVIKEIDELEWPGGRHP